MSAGMYSWYANANLIHEDSSDAGLFGMRLWYQAVAASVGR